MLKKNQKIGFVFAMEAEAEQLIKQLGLKKYKQINSVQIFNNEQENIFVSLNGKCKKTGVDHIGTNGAILNTYILNETIKPDLIINAGTAGGFKRKGANIGDIYLANSLAIFHDRRIPLPVFDKYGEGRYSLPDNLNIAEKLQLKKGVISTGNSLDYTSKELDFFIKEDVSLKDMEAASIAWICKEINKPFIAIKSITDIVDGEIESAVEFEKNFTMAVENLTTKLIELIELLKN